MHRKFGKDIQLSEIMNTGIAKLKSLLNNESGKRPEENYKFTFNFCYKKMKKDLKKELKLKKSTRKSEVELLFYNHYFLEISETLKIPLDQFYLPKNSIATKHLKLNAHKSINGKYIENISKSRNFMQKLTKYLQEQFRQDCSERIEKKLDDLVSKWESKNPKKVDEKYINELAQSILVNKKFKLPWTCWEMEEAVAQTLKLFSDN